MSMQRSARGHVVVVIGAHAICSSAGNRRPSLAPGKPGRIAGEVDERNVEEHVGTEAVAEERGLLGRLRTHGRERQRSDREKT
jgi:hypothetical protein